MTTIISVPIRKLTQTTTETRELLRRSNVQHDVYFNSQDMTLYVNNDKLAGLLPTLIEMGLMT